MGTSGAKAARGSSTVAARTALRARVSRPSADSGSKETYAQSGDGEAKAEDDQTIAPPG